MDFLYSEDQTLLKNSVERLAKDLAGTKATDAERWAQFAEMGLLGLLVPEEIGGVGASVVEAMIVGEALGRSLLTDPYGPAAVIATRLLIGDGRGDALAACATGARLIVPAFAEPQGRYDLADTTTRAQADDQGYRLTGRKAVVLAGAEADGLVISARLHGDQRDPDGIGLFLVPGAAPGLVRRGYRTLDGRSAADLEFTDLRVPSTAMIRGGFAALTAAMDAGIAVQCGEAVGAMAALFELTAEYLRTRKQFGAPLGKFQALQHKLVDMRTAVELARSMAAAAAMAADQPDARERQRIISAAKAQIDRGGRFLGQAAIQLHGAMGMTEEYDAGRYVKRLLVLSSLNGDADHHLDRFQAVA